MVISKKKKKKKRSSPKFGLLFLAVPHHHLSKFPDFAQIFHIAARKTMVLPKYFLLTARKILILPKSSKLGGAIAPPAPPAGTAMLRDDAKPVIQQPRHIAYALRPKLKATLERLTRDGMVADVDCPTEWVSNLVVVEKKDKSLRLCLDPKPLNAAIMRERYAIPTPADVQAQLCGKRVFRSLT